MRIFFLARAVPSGRSVKVASGSARLPWLAGASVLAVFLLSIAFPPRATAQSAGCMAINADFGAGAPITFNPLPGGPNETINPEYGPPWVPALPLDTGDTIVWSAQSFGPGDQHGTGPSFYTVGFAINTASTDFWIDVTNAGNINFAVSGSHTMRPVDENYVAIFATAENTHIGSGLPQDPPSSLIFSISCVPAAPPEPTITSIAPAVGPTAGGTPVTITGTNLTGATSVTFGGIPATDPVVVAPTMITATIPAHAAGVVDVVVTTPGGTATQAGGFTYVAPPTVSSVVPAVGPMSGGTVVIITGTNFAGPTSVTFGGIPASGVTLNSATRITVTTPPHVSGLVDVAVTTPGGTATLADSFTYVAPATITAIVPNAGPVAGGTAVVITGSSFIGATAVTFGDFPASDVTVDSATQITATTPAHAAGVVNVRVATVLGGVTLVNGFTYFSPPTIASIAPDVGPASGGTSVVITGTNLTGATGVTFGGIPASSVTLDSATQITAVTPAHAGGAVDVEVTTPGGTATLADGFTYVPLPTISNIVPGSGPEGGGTSVVITGSNFSLATRVAFGGASVSFTLDSSVQITTATPPGSGTVDVEVTTPGGTAVEPGGFTYTPPASTDATLSALSLSTGTLDPAFAPAVTDYEALVPNATEAITVTPTANDAGAMIEVNGTAVASGLASGPILLAVGPNSIAVAVTAEDGSTTGTYTVTVTREAPVTLVLDPPGGVLAPGEVGTAYAATFTATGGSGNYSFAVTAGTLPDGLALAPDGVLAGSPTTVENAGFTVTATDTGAPANTGSASFTLQIQPPPASDNAELADLVTSAGQLEPAFDPGILSYEIGVAYEVDTFTATPTATDPGATIEVNGQVVASGTASRPVALVVGSNSVQIVVTAEDGVTTRTYTLTVQRAEQVRPDPSLDPEVIGLLNAQGNAAVRLAQYQLSNFGVRLEQLHGEDDTRTSSIDVRLEPFAGASFDGLDLGMVAAWASGFVNVGQRNGSFDLGYTAIGLSGGVDYRFSAQFVAGAGIGYGRDRTAVGGNGTESRANAFTAAVYGSYQPLDNLFIDGVLGGSWLGLDSRRFIAASGEIASGRRSGTQFFGSVTVAYEFRDQDWLVAPYGRIGFSRSRLASFTETGGGVHALAFGSQTVATLATVLGVRASYTFPMDWGVLTPGVRIEYSHDFGGSSSVSLGYADLGGMPYSVGTGLDARDFLTLGLSLDTRFLNDWTLGIGYRGRLGGSGNGDHSFGARLGVGF